MDKFYKEELEENKSYHVDHGEGLDCYKVGHTLGAGGIAPYTKDTIWIGNHYTTADVIASGILRTIFRLTYDSIQVGNQVVSQNMIVSIDAGSQFNKARVSYDGDFDSMDLAAGIYLHENVGPTKADPEKGYIVYAENAISDAGIPAGRNYVGVILTTPIKEVFRSKEHLSGITSYLKGTTLEYYFGGGWSQWGFKSDEEWFRYVEEYRDKITQPLTVKVANYVE